MAGRITEFLRGAFALVEDHIVSAGRTALGGDDINTRCSLASWCSAGLGLNFNKGSTNPLPVCAAAKYDQAEMREERRLVWRVLRQWKGIADGGRFPRRDEIDPWLQGEDGANCLLIAVGWSVEFSQTVVVGVNLAAALCRTDTLAGLLLSRAARVVSARRGLMVEGSAALREVNILYRALLLPISGNGATIDHVLGAANYRSLRDDEPPMRPGIVGMQWI